MKETENQEIMKLDLKDKKILFELDFHARMPYSQLAKKVGLSKQGAEYKVQNLIKKGVIKGFYPVINVPKMGYLYCRLALVVKNITPETDSDLIRDVAKREGMVTLRENAIKKLLEGETTYQEVLRVTWEQI